MSFVTALVADFAPVALSSKETLAMSYRSACQAIEDKIPGDFIECGVFAGSQCAIMARALMDSGCKDRKVHLFDSFSGIPEPGPEDEDFLRVGHHAGLSACGNATVMMNMSRWGIDPSLLVYHVGDFKDTLPVAESMIQQIAVLRLDGDLYESTKVCLKYLYPKLSVGGICIVDDYGLDGCRKAVNEFMGGGFPPVYWRKE